jgi:hypothetical protein
MTFMEWLSSRLPIVASRPERHAPPALSVQKDTASRLASGVPPEYAALHKYLRDRYASLVVLTFEQIESLLGFSLPEAARTEGSWWTRADRHTGAWVHAHRSAAPKLLAPHVAFERLP